MKHKEKLAKLLGGILAWHGSRLDFLACFLLNLLRNNFKTRDALPLNFKGSYQAKAFNFLKL